jgi:glyoxylase-like metal-dependent hydrolase (beta-lactamase superfamily II)
LAGPTPAERAEAGKVNPIAPDVYFHEGQLSETADAVCNNGWIIFEDYVLVINPNFPAGAKQIISKIRALTNKPIRFALDAHNHGDHAHGIRSSCKTARYPSSIPVPPRK